jgi:probable HAF family extracellular repeat protein
MRNLRIRILVAMTALGAVLMMPSAATCGDITVIGTPTAGGYHFVNFDGPSPNTGGTTINGIANNGTVVGFTTDANGALLNFTATPPATAATSLNINNSTTAMANGINSAGSVVGFDGATSAFLLPKGGTPMSIAPPGSSASMAFGINDQGQVVGQYTNASGQTPGFLLNGTSVTTINAPSGPNMVNAQGINKNSLVVGFYLGVDGQDHGFMANASGAVGGSITGKAVADPTIPTSVPGEPGATFVFSQILGINDHGVAVGYYGDSTLSQHGYLYNTLTGQYTFLDNPSEGFNNGVEITQITGINNAGEITGFYTDANGVAHGFVAFAPTTVPEPGSLTLMAVAMTVATGFASRRTRRASPSDLFGARSGVHRAS